MFGNTHYFGTFRKVKSVFGTIFNDVNIVRRDANGVEKERIKVPIAYGPSERYIGRNEQDPDLTSVQNISLPRMAYEIKSYRYNNTRKRQSLEKQIRLTDDNGIVKRQFIGVPYTLSVELYIMTKFVEDAEQIVEQILPWFTPDYTVAVKVVPDMTTVEDMPIVLTGVTAVDNYESDWMERRDIVWTLSFDVHVNVFGPIKEVPVIKKIQTDTHIAGVGDEVTPRISRVTIEVDPEDATMFDDYGYTELYEDFSDGKVYDPVADEDVDLE